MEYSTDSNRTRHAFIPTKIEAIVIPIAVFLFLVLSNSMTFLQSIDGKTYPLFTEYIQARSHSFLETLDRVVGPKVPLLLFWMAVGIVTYVLCWLIYSVYTTYRSDVRSIKKDMVAPANYNESKAWHENIARFFTRIIAAILLIFWIYLLLTQMLPSTTDIFLDHLTNFRLISVPYIILSVLTLSGAIFVVSLLARCVVLRDRVFVS